MKLITIIFYIDAAVSIKLQIVNIYKLGVIMNIICNFFLVSKSKLQPLLQSEKTRLFFNILLRLFLKKNIL